MLFQVIYYHAYGSRRTQHDAAATQLNDAAPERWLFLATSQHYCAPFHAPQHCFGTDDAAALIA